VAVPSGWEDHDATLVGSWLVLGELVTSSHPVGCVQIRVRRRLRTRRLAVVVAVAGAAAVVSPWAPLVVGAAALADTARGARRTGTLVRFVVEEATA
jgi:ferric-dicitrate binding protein FerR (iron transport regulator)